MRRYNDLSISIITPTFNRVNELSRLIESLKSQTIHVKELIIVDDGSTDNTEQYINDQIDSFPFKVVYQRSDNKGMLHAVNIGLSLLTSTHFFKLDSDDFLSNEAIQTILNTISTTPKTYNNRPIHSYSFAANDNFNLPLNNFKLSHEFLLTKESQLFVGRYSDIRLNNLITGDLLDVFPSKLINEQFRYPRFKNEHRFSGLISLFLQDYSNSYTIFSSKSILIKSYSKTGITLSKKQNSNHFPRSYLIGSIWELILTRDNINSARISAFIRFIKSFLIIIKQEIFKL
tara:strand:+ start:365 stop:1228 length:864 start_codon:yes stop_codon:yes gene_type:complete